MRGDRFSAPTGWEELWALLDRTGVDVRVVGGGTWVVPELQRGREPVHLVSLRRLALAGIDREDACLRLGAMTTYADLLSSSLVQEAAPMLWHLARGVTGGPQLRTQGTIGGAAVAARPQSDAPAALCALGATLVLASAEVTRRVPAQEFFLDAGRSDVRRGEVLTDISVPTEISVPTGPTAPVVGHGYVKIKAAASSWPVVTAGAVLRTAPDGAIGGTVAVGGLGRRPVTVELAALLGGPLSSLEDALRGDELVLPPPTDAWEDELAPADYRRAVAPVAVRRALAQAGVALRQTGGSP